MKRNWTRWLESHVLQHRSLYIFTTVLLFMGIIFGAVVVNSLGLDHKQDLYVYLRQFFGQVSEGQVASSSDIFIQTMTHHFMYTGAMLLLGLSVIGAPFILLLLFFKGLVVGFTVGFLVHQMGIYGFAMAFVGIFPQNVLIVPILILTATLSISISFRLIRRQFFGRHAGPLAPLFYQFAILFLAGWVGLSVAAAYEAFAGPALMRLMNEWQL
ncbi:stage II sporulation protein M [Salsuginibacillus halophilus]|uniref:Stage II sporulation protein M n=1 Tax=Salsuginibacillus halophilus TaxID=517424 RepID=A0A2P8HAN3_9BACI|nr:stage II sporulation protein M [Salsuginibacillus halophilus]PSL43286.1 stage II sporulation protein M [Salsuginibacillus halophilus]